MSKTNITILATALLIAGVSIGGYVKREAITTRINHWRSTTLLADSKEAGESSDWKEAERLVTAAWQLRPYDITILRHWFTVAREERSSDVLALAHAVFQHPDANAEDRKGVLELLLAIGDRVTFARFIDELPEKERKQPDTLDFEARFLLGIRQAATALEKVRELISIRDEPTDQWLLATALAHTPSAENSNRIEAQEIIHRLFQSDENHPLALAAFSLLGQIPKDQWQLELFVGATERLSEIGEATEIPTGILLLDIDRRLLSDTANREAIIGDTVKQFKDEAPEALYQWLLQQERPDQVLEEITTKEAAAESPVFFGLRVSAYLQKKDWASASQLLANPPKGIDAATALAYRGAVASQQGKPAEAQKRWEEAFALATNSHGREALLRIAKLAGSGNEAIRNRAVTEALKRPTAISMPAAEVSFVMPHFVESDAFGDMLVVCRNLYRSEPNNSTLLNNVAWMGPINESFQGRTFVPKLEQMVEQSSDHRGFRSILTLAYLSQGDINKAEATSLALAESENKLNGDLAVLALLRANQDNTTAAKDYLKEVDWRKMMTRERLYFRRHLKSAGVIGVSLTLPK